MKCAFIVSPSYSGSTLLSILLAHHPDLVTLGEFLDNRVRRYREGEGDFCSCGARLAECPYLAGMTERIQAKGVDFSVDFPDTAFWSGRKWTDKILRAYVRGGTFETLRHLAIATLPPVRNTIDHVVARNMAVISSLLEMEGAKVYLDSAKNNNRVIYLHRYAKDMDVRVIWLIRDGRGVSNSIIGHTGVDIATAARRWDITQRSVIRAVESLPPENVLKMKYEDLCEFPGAKLAEACRFLDLDPSQIPESFSAEGLHLTGNNMRLNGLGAIKRDVKWMKSLSPADLDVFESIGGALNRDLGYSREFEAPVGD